MRQQIGWYNKACHNACSSSLIKIILLHFLPTHSETVFQTERQAPVRNGTRTCNIYIYTSNIPLCLVRWAVFVEFNTGGLSCRKHSMASVKLRYIERPNNFYYLIVQGEWPTPYKLKSSGHIPGRLNPGRRSVDLCLRKTTRNFHVPNNFRIRYLGRHARLRRPLCTLTRHQKCLRPRLRVFLLLIFK